MSDQFWEEVVCPICEKKDKLEIMYKDVETWEYPGEFQFLRCRRCNMIFQSPRVKFDKSLRYYKSKTYWGLDVTNQKSSWDWTKEREKHYGVMYRGILKRKKTGKILDVGCGLGLFLSKFSDLGWDVFGTEVSPDVAKFAKEKFGTKVFLGDLTKINFKQRFDVIVFSSVFEHLYWPNQTLQKVKKLLKENGLLVITLPNIESLGHMLFQNDWHTLDPGRHIYQYSPGTISELLSKHGFGVEDINHNYFTHNYYGLFTSLRYKFSPKFKKARNKKDSNHTRLGTESSLKMEVGKILANIFAYFGALIEGIINKGESMTVYAKKA